MRAVLLGIVALCTLAASPATQRTAQSDSIGRPADSGNATPQGAVGTVADTAPALKPVTERESFSATPPANNSTSDTTERTLRADSLPEDAVKIGLTLLPLLMGLLIRSPIRKSEEIKAKLLNFSLTFVKDAEPGDVRGRQREALRDETRRLHHLFDENELAYREFVRLSRLCWVVLAVLFAVIGLSLWNYLLPPAWMPTPLGLGLLVIIGLQVIVLFSLRRIYMVEPDMLRSVRYLVCEMDVDPNLLIPAMNANGAIHTTTATENQRREDPLSVVLSTDVLVFGFRTLSLVFGGDGRVYFVSFGPIRGLKDVTRHLLPPGTIIEQREIAIISLGQAPLNLISDAQELQVLILVFLAVFSDKDVRPLYTQGELRVFGTDPGRWSLGGGIGGFDLDLGRLYDGVRFSGKGLNIRRLSTTDEAEDVLKRVIREYGRKIRTCKTVKTYFSPEGRLAQPGRGK